MLRASSKEYAVHFQLLLLLTLKCIIVFGNELGLREYWLSLRNLEDPEDEETTLDPMLPVREWPEEQLATSASEEGNFSFVDLTKLLEDVHKDGPLWKYRGTNNEYQSQDEESKSIPDETDDKDQFGPALGNVSEDKWIENSSDDMKKSSLDNLTQLQLRLEMMDSNNVSNKMSSGELKRYSAEIKAGDKTQLLGVHHIYQPKNYRLQDLGTGFSPRRLFDVGTKD